MKKKLLFKIWFCPTSVSFLVMTVVAILPGSQAFSFQNGNAKQNTSALINQLTASCESTKKTVVLEIMAPLKPNPKAETQRQINLFRAGIRKVFPKSTSQEWETLLMLDKLQQSLREDETDLELLDTILDILNGDASDVQRPSFVRLKKSLETNRPLLWRQNQQSHIDEVEAVFDSLPGLIDRYMKSPNVANAEAVSSSLRFLSETPTTGDLIAMICRLVLQPNLTVRMNSSFVAPFFLRDVDEQVTINDNILGTWVRGSGQLIGKTQAVFVPSHDSVMIRVTLEGTLNSKTVGTNGPVRIPSNNVTEVKTVKDITIASGSIKTTPAMTDAKLTSQIGQVAYTRPAPIARMVAPSQISQRKPASNVESERLTKVRFNARFNSEIDETVLGFVNEFTKWGNHRNEKRNLRLQFDRMATTRNTLSADVLVGNKYQLTTTTRPPTVTTRAELFFQVHESLANNAGECELGGKTLFEDQFMAQLKKLFPLTRDQQEGEDVTNEPMLTISFSERPITASFTDNTIKVMVETTAIERAGNLYSGMVIEFVFRIEAADNGFRLVVAETPEVLPLGFNPEEDQLSMQQTAIRAIVKKKLDRFTEQPIEWKESVIEAKNGTMTLKPVHLSARNGWLSVGLSHVEWTAKTESEN